MSLRGVLRVSASWLAFWCPGCLEHHTVTSVWTFNGDYDKPTFLPSVLLTSGHHVPGWQGPDCWCSYNREHPEDTDPFVCRRCHSYVKDGNIEFLPDSTHALAGKTVPLEPR